MEESRDAAVATPRGTRRPEAAALKKRFEEFRLQQQAEFDRK